MTQTDERSCFTVGVFQDTVWAERGLVALRRHGFATGALSILAKHTSDAVALVERALKVEVTSVEIEGLGAAVASGPLVSTLRGRDKGLDKIGVAATIRRAGFQDHDGFIFETLIGRGGILVAVEGEPQAADALTVLHAYGGGNAAIGAWIGRV